MRPKTGCSFRPAPTRAGRILYTVVSRILRCGRRPPGSILKVAEARQEPRRGVMNDATAPVRHWQQLLTPFVFALTQPGYARFAQWVTGTALGWEEHTITQVLTSIGLE